MSDNNNNLLVNSITSNSFIRDCIDLAIDGFLFRGITPSDHYYHFSQSFPQASTLSTNQQTKNIPLLDLSYLKSNVLSEQKSALTHHSSKNPTILIDTSKLNQSELNLLEIEVQNIEERMKKQRLRNNRPDELSKMTIKQILDEKTTMQQELLKFENKYSKPTLSEHKKIMKPVYDYYRQLKRLVEKQ